MGAKNYKIKIEDAEDLQKRLDKFFQELPADKPPSWARLLDVIGFISLDSLHKNMDRDDVIGDILSTAYNKAVALHEEHLFKPTVVGSIFFLKACKRNGFDCYSDNPESKPTSPDLRIELEVVERKHNETKSQPTTTELPSKSI